jgi:hypothetical protein
LSSVNDIINLSSVVLVISPVNGFVYSTIAVDAGLLVDIVGVDSDITDVSDDIEVGMLDKYALISFSSPIYLRISLLNIGLVMETLPEFL